MFGIDSASQHTGFILLISARCSTGLITIWAEIAKPRSPSLIRVRAIRRELKLQSSSVVTNSKGCWWRWVTEQTARLPGERRVNFARYAPKRQPILNESGFLKKRKGGPSKVLVTKRMIPLPPTSNQARMKPGLAKNYIAMAARTFGRGCIGPLVLPEILGEAGLVMMYRRTSQTSRVPVPIVLPFSSWIA